MVMRWSYEWVGDIVPRCFVNWMLDPFLLSAGSERVNRVVTWKGSAVYIVKSNYDVLLVQAPRSLQAENLTELDKLYLLLAEHNLGDSFNVLCYDLKIRSIADLNELDDEALKEIQTSS